MRIYLCGPMRGYPKLNFPAFMRAAKRLRKMGHEVFNPAEADLKEGLNPLKRGELAIKPLAHYLAHDLRQVCLSEAVAVLPGWDRSQGARIEVWVAKALDIPVLDAGTLRPIDGNVLEEANRIVYGERNAAYGHPADDFAAAAGILRILVRRRYGHDIAFTPDFWGLIMAVACKGSREAGLHGRDNCTDGAGYYATIMRCFEPGAVKP
jgi:hypothetical protein